MRVMHQLPRLRPGETHHVLCADVAWTREYIHLLIQLSISYRLQVPDASNNAPKLFQTTHEHLSCTSRRHINHQCKPEPQYISSSDTCGISLSTTNGLAPQSFSSLSPVKVWGIRSSTEQFSTARSIHNPIVHAADSTQSSSLTKYTPKTLPVTTSPNRAGISSKKR